MLRLYYSPLACSIGAHIALEESGADYDAIAVNVLEGENRRSEFLALNPKGFVPVLITNRGPLTESTAILSYIAQSFPDAELLPTNDAFGLATATSFNAFLASAVHVTYRHLSRPRLFADGEIAHAALAAKVPEMLAKYFGLVEQQLSDGRPWIHGQRYTVSDPYLFIYASYLFWKGDRGDPKNFPRLLAHRERVLTRPATQRVLIQEGIQDPATYGRDTVLPPLDSPEMEAALDSGQSMSYLVT